MIPITSYSGKSVAVFGLGMSGLGTAKALIEGGATVACWDDGEKGRENAEKAGYSLVDLNTADWSGFDSLILAPGVPLTHPKPHWTVEKASAAGVEVIGDTELFFREHKHQNSKSRIIGITGTNGKSTTTALVAHLLKDAGKKVEMGGNIGKAVLDLAPFADENIYVIEYSSYQIDLTPSLHLDGAALLNITPDHIDRHGTLEHYAKVKERIFQNLEKSQTAVISVDDELCVEIADRLNGDFETQKISVKKELQSGICAKDAELYEAHNGESKFLVSLKNIDALRGAHNWQNAAIAFALVRSMGLSTEDIQSGLKTFPGLEHRMQQVARNGATIYINDSKATNADAAEKALSAFKNIYWIVGGVPKEGGIKPLRPYFKNIAKAYLIGEAAKDFANVLAGNTAFEISETLDKAVEQATKDAAQSDAEEKVILLSPACASFDQYPNFMLRGDAFCEIVKKQL